MHFVCAQQERRHRKIQIFQGSESLTWQAGEASEQAARWFGVIEALKEARLQYR
ncbi:MAG: hypothetical protein ACOYXT_26745 [Bacteroidota bacterium]